MSTKIFFMGRATADPVIATSQNGSEHITLDFGTTQRGQDGKEESVYYRCFFSKFLADRLTKANVKKGTCLTITGTLDLHPFLYQQGAKAGQPGINANVRVLDWDFTISNRADNTGVNQPAAGQNGTAAGNPGVNGNYQNGSASTPPQTGGMMQQSQGNVNYAQGAQNYQRNYQAAPQQQYASNAYPNTPPANGVYMQGGYDGFQNVPQEQLPFQN